MWAGCPGLKVMLSWITVSTWPYVPCPHPGVSELSLIEILKLGRKCLFPKNNPWCRGLGQGSAGTDPDCKGRSRGWLASSAQPLQASSFPAPPHHLQDPGVKLLQVVASTNMANMSMVVDWGQPLPCKPCPSVSGEVRPVPCPTLYTERPLSGSLPRLTKDLPFLICPS